MKKAISFAAVLTIVLGLAMSAQASLTPTLAWDQSDTPGVTGNKIYYGTSSGIYTVEVDLGLATSYTLPLALSQSTDWYFATTAYDIDSNESGFSNEVHFSTYDTDGDGLLDGDEFNVYGTDINSADSDNDGIDDDVELAMWGSTHWNDDDDGDGIINLLDPDSDGDGIWDGYDSNPSLILNPLDGLIIPYFGIITDLVIIGDWNGDGKSKIGVARQNSSTGKWEYFLDYNGNGIWESGIDTAIPFFGLMTDTPLIGDWNGDGKSKIGVARQNSSTGKWEYFLDYNGNGIWESGIDTAIPFFGLMTDTPLIGDWNGDGKSKIGVARQNSSTGKWEYFLDYNGNGIWESGIDTAIPFFGLMTDTPLIGDWNGDGKSKIGVARQNSSTGKWEYFLDYNGNGIWESGIDTAIASFGDINYDTPVVGDWNGDGKSKIGVARQSDTTGKWAHYLDYDNNGAWNGL